MRARINFLFQQLQQLITATWTNAITSFIVLQIIESKCQKQYANLNITHSIIDYNSVTVSARFILFIKWGQAIYPSSAGKNK